MAPRQDVEALFTTRTVAEIREAEAKTQHEIEEKKKQLRQVVGDSYRELISSADTIIEINTSCHRLVGLVDELKGGLHELAASVAHGEGGAPAQQAASSYDKLYALGSRIKYMLDTPETIYGCLESGEFLEAARRYVRAAELHRLLGSHTRTVAQRFPLLHHQWPLVKKFRQQIWGAAAAWLAGQGGLSSQQAAAALAALALLKPMGGADVLKAYLGARQAYIMACLQGATGPQGDLDSLAVVLADVAGITCATVAQCGELFLQLPGVTTTPLLARAAAGEAASSGDVMFDAGKEAAAWQGVVSGVQERLSDLSAAGLALECSQWLEQLAQQVQALGGSLLARCSSGADLLKVEAAVKAELEAWRFTLQPQPAADSAAAVAGAAAFAPPPAAEAAVTLAWSDVCQWVLGRPTGLWPLLLEQALVERAKQLVARDFGAAAQEVTALLQAALEDASSLPPSAPGTYQPDSWSDLVLLQPNTPGAQPSGGASSKRRRMSRTRSGVAAADGSSEAALRAWLEQAEQVLRAFDQQLSTALTAALDACCYGQAGGAGSGVPRRTSAPDYAASRAVVLEPYVQDRCAEAAERIVAELQARAQDLPLFVATPFSSEAAAAFAREAHRALTVGRVALGIAGRSSNLRVILGPPEHWHAARAGADAAADAGRTLAGRLAADATARAQAGGAAAGIALPHSNRLEQLQLKYRAVGMQAYDVWAAWAASSLSAALLAGLAADHALAAELALRTWEETVISGAGDELSAPEAPGGGEGEAGAGMGDMRFVLPAAASPAVMQLALGACQEVDRAGGHLLEQEPLQLFKWQLGSGVTATLRSAVEEGGQLGAKLSEKGVLQLLFDVRFLADLLSGGLPASTSPSDVAGSNAAASARRREVGELESALAERLDPIDWATYEAYLYANKDRAATRCQVLFGMLLRWERPRKESSASAVAGESNVLQMAPAGPRFSYLPVNTPSLLRHSSMQLQPGSLGAPRRTSSGVLGSGAAADAAQYSFANITMGREGARSRGSSDGTEGAGPSGSVGAAARLMGSLIGDKAAEVTSALGEYSFGTQFSSIGAGIGAGINTQSLLSSFNLSSFKRP